MIRHTPQWSRRMKQDITCSGNVVMGFLNKFSSDHRECGGREEYRGAVPERQPRHGLEYAEQQHPAEDALGRDPPPGGEVGGAEDVVSAAPEDGQHGDQLRDAAHEQQLPRVHVRDVLHHHVAADKLSAVCRHQLLLPGGEAETREDGAGQPEVHEGGRGLVGQRPAPRVVVLVAL